ncbi:hypothetical protein AB0J38_25325 [Streptomyces sp. NPDC050095]|uniref:hypothetical protein n=1 Tax=unclassified Streptomyces TaxID=2593676 RepID=UPI00343CFC21
MSRVHVTLASALVALVALTGCSSGSTGADSSNSTSRADKPAAAPAPKPITVELSQAQLTQALLSDGENLPGWTPSRLDPFTATRP